MVRELMDLSPEDTDPMAFLRTGVSMLALFAFQRFLPLGT